MSKLDELLEPLGLKAIYDPLSMNLTQHDLFKQQIKDLMLELIGDDYPMPDIDDHEKKDVVLMAREFTQERNKMLDIIRRKVEEL